MNAVVQQPRSTSRTRRLTVTAMMAAISTVVMFFEFTFPPFPPFLKFDLSGLPVLLTSFMMGPAQAVTVVLIKDLIHLLSTTTGGVGELADFLILSSFAITAGLIHRRLPSARGTALACACGSLVIAVLYPVLIGVFYKDITLVLAALLFSAIVFIAHRENIKRLIKGNENKISFKSKK